MREKNIILVGVVNYYIGILGTAPATTTTTTPARMVGLFAFVVLITLLRKIIHSFSIRRDFFRGVPFGTGRGGRGPERCCG